MTEGHVHITSVTIPRMPYIVLPDRSDVAGRGVLGAMVRLAQGTKSFTTELTVEHNIARIAVYCQRAGTDRFGGDEGIGFVAIRVPVRMRTKNEAVEHSIRTGSASGVVSSLFQPRV